MGRGPWPGVAYYRKRFGVDRRDIGKQLWIEFEGAMHLADVWVNGRHVAQHAGGYTPFVLDVTGQLKAVDKEILVRLDNRDNPLVPPGKPQDKLDFCYYGGIYRDVRLLVNNPVHITHPIMAGEKAGGGIFVTYPEVSERRAVVNVRTQVANNSADEGVQPFVRHTLYEWDRAKGRGRKVASAQSVVSVWRGAAATVSQDIVLDCPRLWYPDSPSLYVLRTEVIMGREAVDTEETRIGIRRLEMSKAAGFLINGRPYRLEGTNRHQDYPYVGNAIPDNAQYRDIHQIRSSGYNVVRLGHYPQDPSVLDACDELGLMAIEPIPGWQFFNKSDIFVANTYKDVRDLIRRDRNHPSVIMWETTLNESWPPTDWKDGSVRTAHEEYPGDQCFTSGDTYGYDGFDVCYNDWQEGFNRPNRTAKPSFIREYYDYEFGGHYSTTRVGRGDGDRQLVQNAWNAQWSHNRYRAYYPHTMGGAVWSMYDYNRGCCDNICQSGTADIFRLPKFSLDYFRTQTAPGSYTPDGPKAPEVAVASHWMEGSPDTLLVYGNVDEVELLLNGRSLGRRGHDRGPATQDYVPRPDGGNADNIDFPPFTFSGIAWESGRLEAVGYIGGREVARQVVRTPGAPAALGISYFEGGRPASREDLLIVYVSLRDTDGTLCFGENGRKAGLEVISGGSVVGPASIAAEAGTASFLVRTGSGRSLVLRATSGILRATRKIRLRSK